ncbi:protein farnesyltransferase/geranylgeranyltransferase type-1 subunit alpha, putative, partial [Entamoeba invadens IP1]
MELEDSSDDEITLDISIFKDIQPTIVPIAPVCSINYSDKFKEAMSYYRAIMARDELSDRALLLTGVIIQMNSADYTAWYYRRRILKSKPSFNTSDEYDFISKLGDHICKNYQVWGHRQYLVSLTNDYVKELEFTGKMLEDDNKNYHCWSHRVWVCNKFNCWAGELEYTEKMIDADVRNNSAWSHRFYTLKVLGFLNDSEKLPNELRLIEKTLHKASNNEAVWTYLTGLYEKSTNTIFKDQCKAFIKKIVDERQFCVYA